MTETPAPYETHPVATATLVHEHEYGDPYQGPLGITRDRIPLDLRVTRDGETITVGEDEYSIELSPEAAAELGIALLTASALRVCRRGR